VYPSSDRTPPPTGAAGRRREDRRADAGPVDRSALDDRRPYPTAPSTTRPSYARPGPPRSRRAVRTPPPIPSTVWICPPDPRGAARTTGLELWAREVLAAILAAFTAPLDRVGVLPWPDPTGHLVGDSSRSTRPHFPVAGGIIHDRLGPAFAVDVISAEFRIPTLLDLRPDTAPTRLGSGDACARIVDRSPDPAEPISRRSTDSGTDDHSPRAADRPRRCDLIITGAEPGHVDPDTAHQVTLAAARMLRLGGTLVALTHSDHTDGRLVDPGGLLVAAAQDADLLYFQHIVAMSAPHADLQRAPNRRPDQHGATTEPPSPDTAVGLGWRPRPHRRVHIDLYVFGQPHDHSVDDHAADEQPAADRHGPPYPMGAASEATGGSG
jgi:hypothetical protein